MEYRGLLLYRVDHFPDLANFVGRITQDKIVCGDGGNRTKVEPFLERAQMGLDLMGVEQAQNI